MHKGSILRDLSWHIDKSETCNEVWISDIPQDDHVDKITDCSTWYGQAPAAKGSCATATHNFKCVKITNICLILDKKFQMLVYKR